ncbi:MAG: hypothetical protein ACM3O3_07385 [Syntrophothermus sp.]
MSAKESIRKKTVLEIVLENIINESPNNLSLEQIKDIKTVLMLSKKQTISLTENDKDRIYNLMVTLFDLKNAEIEYIDVKKDLDIHTDMLKESIDEKIKNKKLIIEKYKNCNHNEYTELIKLAKKNINFLENVDSNKYKKNLEETIKNLETFTKIKEKDVKSKEHIKNLIYINDIPVEVSESTTSKVIETIQTCEPEALKQKKYDTLPTNPILTTIKRHSIFAHNNRHVPSLKSKIKCETYRTGDMELTYKSGTDKFTITFKEFKALGNRAGANFRKTFNYLFIKANEQNFNNKIYFQMSNYKNELVYKDIRTAYKAFKRYYDEFMKITVSGVGYTYKKQKKDMKYIIFTGMEISLNDCCITVDPEFMKACTMYFTVLPKWANKLNVKAYDMLDYIYTQYRQKNNQEKLSKEGHFNISFRAINEYIGGYNPKETTRHFQFIIDPMLKAFDEIEENRKDDEIKLTPIYDTNYKNGHDFLEGYLKIELDEKILDHAKSFNKKRSNKKNKNDEIKKLTKENKRLKNAIRQEKVN